MDRGRCRPAAGAASDSLQLSISEDKVHFGTVPEPIILYDEYNWQRPAPTELYAYPSMVADRGFNNIARHFFLAYMYVPPNEDFSQRYLVAQEGVDRRLRAAAVTASAHRAVAVDRLPTAARGRRPARRYRAVIRTPTTRSRIPDDGGAADKALPSSSTNAFPS